MLSKEGEITTTPKVEVYKIADAGPAGQDDFALGAMLVIADYEENIKAITTLLAEMDTKPAQVLIESTVLQTKLSEENAFGIDFALIKDLNFSDFTALTAGPHSVANALITGRASAATGLAPASNQAIAASSTVGNTTGKGGLKLGFISGNLSAFVRLLDEVTDTTVLANPKLLTLNRQPSRVLVGRRVAYLSTTATETSATQTVQYLDTGVQLYVRPFVSSSGDVRMEIKPQVSTADIKEIKGPTGNVVTVPDEVTQEVVTNIIVPDGMTVVIGGLFTETTIAGRSQIPGLGELPIIGAAFRGQSDSTTRDEIIFLVTPTIVNDKTLIAQGVQAKGMEDRMRAGAPAACCPGAASGWPPSAPCGPRPRRQRHYQMAMNHIASAISIYPNYEDARRLRSASPASADLADGQPPAGRRGHRDPRPHDGDRPGSRRPAAHLQGPLRPPQGPRPAPFQPGPAREHHAGSPHRPGEHARLRERRPSSPPAPWRSPRPCSRRKGSSRPSRPSRTWSPASPRHCPVSTPVLCPRRTPSSRSSQRPQWPLPPRGLRPRTRPRASPPPPSPACRRS